MPGDTTFSFLDAAQATKTARAGSDAGGNLAPSAVLYDVNGAVLIGQKVAAASLPVVVASDQSALPTQAVRAATPAQSSVVASSNNVSLLLANANRLGATIFNDSTVNLYLRLGATASATNFTVRMLPASYYETPYGYTGAIDGIWDSATGNARITELT